MTEQNERFNVVQFFEDGSYNYEARNITARQAVDMVSRFTDTVGVRLGIVKRIIITDMLDCIAFEWNPKDGVVFPPQEKAKTK